MKTAYSADKTSQQLLTAKIMGKVLLCQLDSLWLTLSSVYNTATFEFTTVKMNTKCCITIYPDGTISYQADVLATGESRLPNPKKITITGASTAEYDGSDEVEVQVPYKTSQLENDSGFLTDAPVKSVNGQTGEIKLPTVAKITITEQADGTIEPDLPHEDILAAYNAGNTVCCKYKGRLLPLIVASEAICSFGCVHSGKVYAVNITRASAVASVVPLTSGDNGSAPADAVLHTPQDLTPEQQAQARLNIGVSQKQEIEVVLNDIGASLVGASVKTVFGSIDAGNTVVLYRNIEDGTRVYYQLRERKEDAGGGESLTFTYRSTVVIDDIILHNGGFFDGSIGHGTENLTADTVGAVPAPMTAEIGQAMCVTEVDEDGKPVEWGAADLVGGGNANICNFTTTSEQEVNGITVELPTTLNKFYIINFRIQFASGLSGDAMLYSNQGNGYWKGYGVQLTAGTGDVSIFGLFYNNEYLSVGVNIRPFGVMASPQLGTIALPVSPNNKTITFFNNPEGVNFPAGSSISVWGVYEQ